VVDLAKVKNGGKSHFSAILTLDVGDVAQVQIGQNFVFFGLVHQSHIATNY